MSSRDRFFEVLCKQNMWTRMNDNGSVHLSISCTNSIQEKCSGTVQEMSRSCLGMVQKHVLDEFILKKCRAVMEISWTLPGELLWTFPEQFPNAFPGRN